MTMRRFYTPDEVAHHNSGNDCWISIFHKVYDLTPLLVANRGPLANPLIEAAGQDISHWFDAKTGDVKTYVDTHKNLRLPYTPHGRFLHIPPAEPTAVWSTELPNGLPWWRDEQYVIGKLSAKTRKIRIANVLTQQEDLLTVCSEEKLSEIQDRYMEYNAHAGSYTWKRLYEGSFVEMDMDLTLGENSVPDESDEFESLGVDADLYIPVIHVYFNDDLTYA